MEKAERTGRTSSFSAPNIGSDQTVYIENEKEEPSIVIYKYDSRTGKPLAGVTFEIKGSNIYTGVYVTTDENGYIQNLFYNGKPICVSANIYANRTRIYGNRSTGARWI